MKSNVGIKLLPGLVLFITLSALAFPAETTANDQSTSVTSLDAILVYDRDMEHNTKPFEVTNETTVSVELLFVKGTVKSVHLAQDDHFTSNVQSFYRPPLGTYDGRTTFTFTLTPGDGKKTVWAILEGKNDISFPPTSATLTLDTTPPHFRLMFTIQKKGDILVDVSFSEPVHGFTAEDVEIGGAGGRIRDFSGEGSEYHFMLRPNSPRNIKVNINANDVWDIAGNKVNMAPAVESITLPDLRIQNATESNFFVNDDNGGMNLLTSLSEVWIDFLWASTSRDGTESNPYNALSEGLANVSSGGVIKIKNGASRETVRITQAVRLEASGGTARIGDPTAAQIQSPSIVDQPLVQMVLVGNDAYFSVETSGTPPLTYKWSKDGVNLIDDDRILGTDGSMLVIYGVIGSDAGAYRCTVTNSAGSAVSNPANLSLNEIKITAGSDWGMFDRFGYSVSLDANTLIVGAYLDDSPRLNAGSAYIYTRSGTTWTKQQKLVGSTPTFQEQYQFGTSVDISGDTVVVGAPYFNSETWTDVGVGYIFTLSGGVWTEQPRLQDFVNGSSGDLIGYSVGIDGDTVIMGAPGDDSNTGSAYIFTRTGTTWNEQQKLTASNRAAGDRFGEAVAVNEDAVIIGAPGASSSRGAMYVFTRSGSTWTERAILTASDGVAGDTLGKSVSLSGGSFIAGAPAQASSTGSAYVFTGSGATWTQQGKLTAQDGAANDKFGASVDMSGNRAIVGAPFNDGIGAAYTFVRDDSTWYDVAKLTSSDGASNDEYGVSVTINNSSAVVGAQRDDDNGTDSGSAYAYLFSYNQYDLDIRETAQPQNRIGRDNPHVMARDRNRILVWANTGGNTITFDLVKPPDVTGPVWVQIEDLTGLNSSMPHFEQLNTASKSFTYTVTERNDGADLLVRFGNDVNSDGALTGDEITGTYEVYGVTALEYFQARNMYSLYYLPVALTDMADQLQRRFSDGAFDTGADYVPTSTSGSVTLDGERFTHYFGASFTDHGFIDLGGRLYYGVNAILPIYHYADDSDGSELILTSSQLRKGLNAFIAKRTYSEIATAYAAAPGGATRSVTFSLNGASFDFDAAGSIGLGGVSINSNAPYSSAGTITLQITLNGSNYDIGPSATLELTVHDLFDFDYFTTGFIAEYSESSRSAGMIQNAFGKPGSVTNAGQVGLVEIITNGSVTVTERTVAP